MKVPIPQIQIGERHRKDMGDLAALAASIAELGLLQPIGVTEDHRLIFGERRLRACRDILGLTEVEVRVIDMPHIVVGENAENEIRKDFTPSERVAIAQAISEELGNRRGVNQHTPQQGRHHGDNPVSRTDDFAAQRAGFGSRRSYLDAKHVVERAEPETVEAMDSNVLSISAARKVADLPAERQREIVRSPHPVRDLAREFEMERRQDAAKEPPLMRCQTITEAVIDLGNAAASMSPDEFRATAAPATLARFHRHALPALAFLKGMMEVGYDQKRA